MNDLDVDRKIKKLEFDHDATLSLAVANARAEEHTKAVVLQNEVDRLRAVFDSMTADLDAEDVRKSRRGGMGGGLLGETTNFPPSAVSYIRGKCRDARNGR